MADALFLQPAGDDGVIPEYTGYDGHAIKQADVILAFFPLDLALPPERIQANLDYYHDRVLCGPLMTEQIEAAIRLRLEREDKQKVLAELVRAYRRCVHGAFEVPYERFGRLDFWMVPGNHDWARPGLVDTEVRYSDRSERWRMLSHDYPIPRLPDWIHIYALDTNKLHHDH